jgi:hypothetical protein
LGRGAPSRLAVIAKDLGDPKTLQSLTGQPRQIGLKFPIGSGLKTRSGLRIAIAKSGPNFWTDFKSLGTNTRPQPSQNIGTR